jgi:hypothetical protein
MSKVAGIFCIIAGGDGYYWQHMGDGYYWQHILTGNRQVVFYPGYTSWQS